MSRETTEARAVWRHWDAKWKEHRRHCPRCRRESRSRRWAELCAEGAEARAALEAARASLARNRKLDRQPMPGQQALF